MESKVGESLLTLFTIVQRHIFDGSCFQKPFYWFLSWIGVGSSGMGLVVRSQSHTLEKYPPTLAIVTNWTFTNCKICDASKSDKS